jgi:PAS domain S-box-containing protein
MTSTGDFLADRDHAFAGLDEAVRAAADRAGVGITVTGYGPNGPFCSYVNDAAVEMFRRPREEVMQRSYLAFVAPDELEHLKDIARRRRAGEPSPTRVETVILRPDGTRVPIVSFNGHIESGGNPTTVSFFWDTTKQTAETERLARVVSSSPDGIVLVQDGVIRSINAAGARVIGYHNPTQAVGINLDELVVAEEHSTLHERIKAGRLGQPQPPHVFRVRHRDGSLVNLEVSSIPFDHEGKPAMLSFVRDVTDRAQLMEQMARTERLAALSTLAAGLAHEINNPLTAAMLQLDVVEKQALSTAEPLARRELTERFKELRRTHERIGSIMGDFAAFARSGEEHRTRVDLTAVLTSVERMLAPMLKHRGRYRNELGALPRVDADAGRLEQVFMNLLLNGVQALPEGRDGNELTVVGRVENGRVCVEVKDTGQGITAENLRRIFDPFFTTKPLGVGTGLGLTVCHNIVAAYGGEIQAESVVGEGTTMRVLLKPAEGELAAAAQAPARPKVLIVDDEPHLALTLRLLLEDRHDVLTTTEGEQAVAMLLEGAAVDVVLCDLMMPAPDGAEVFRRVTRARPELKGRFIFMTGGVFNAATEDFLKTSHVLRVQKPFHAEHVEALIARVAAGS